MNQEILERHIERHAGPIVARWENLLFIAPSEKHRCHLIVTNSLHESPMSAPEDDLKTAEICVMLPVDWPLEYGQEFNPQTLDEEFFWPIRGLQRVARIPSLTGNWVGVGHTIPNGEPMEPFHSSTPMSCWILFPPVEFPPSFARSRYGGEVLNIHALVPIYRDEFIVRRNQKLGMLLENFGRKGVSDIINPRRRSSLERGKVGEYFGKKS